MKTVFCLLVCVYALSACSTSRLLQIDNFDRDDPSAIVIVGFRSLPPDDHIHRLHWRQVDTMNGNWASSRGAFFATRLASQGKGKTYYELHKILPGTFALEKASGRLGHLILRPQDYVITFRNKTLAVSVRRGEIVYVGNFEVWTKFDLEESGPVADAYVRHVRPNLAEAAQSLRAYPNVKGEMKYRKPKPISVPSDIPGLKIDPNFDEKSGQLGTDGFESGP